jgi:hypothetical protein
MVADVDVFRAGEGNADGPGLQSGIVAEALFKERVVETHSQVGKAKFTGSAADGTPAFVDGLRSGERVLQNVEVYLRLQQLAEVAGVQQAAEDADFGVSEAMNAQPHESAENDDDRLGDVRVHDCQRAESAKGAAGIQNQNRGAGLQTAIEETMVDMAAVR